MNKWLHHHGFSYKKPKGVPHKALKSSCGKEETILFMDAVHPTQATKLSHGWIRTGQDKAIEITGSRSRLNIVGAFRTYLNRC